MKRSGALQDLASIIEDSLGDHRVLIENNALRIDEILKLLNREALQAQPLDLDSEPAADPAEEPAEEPAEVEAEAEAEAVVEVAEPASICCESPTSCQSCGQPVAATPPVACSPNNVACNSADADSDDDSIFADDDEVAGAKDDDLIKDDSSSSDETDDVVETDEVDARTQVLEPEIGKKKAPAIAAALQC